MNCFCKGFRKTHLIKIVVVVASMFTTLSSHAAYYNGGDWGGTDLTLLNGDSLSGTFTNVGMFNIQNGAVISGGASNLSVSAGSILINGSLNGLNSPSYDLSLLAQTTITLNGSLAYWQNIALMANLIAIGDSASITNGTGTVAPISGIFPPSGFGGGSISLRDGNISLGGGNVSLATPIPAAAWLLGSGLLGLMGIRRRNA